MELNLTSRQTQTLSPKMMQSVAILQMTAQELIEYLETILQENPVLEMEESYDPPEEKEELCARLEWLAENDPQNYEYHKQDTQANIDPLRNYGVADHEDESLFHHLQVQIHTMELDPDMEALALFLASDLNQNGWLDEDVSELILETGFPAETVERALRIVQSLEPAGVGARNLSECLCIQLRRKNPVNKLALLIAEQYLDTLSKNKYGVLARALKVSQNEVLSACQVIRGLDPRPGAHFIASGATLYIIPDIVVTATDASFELLYNDTFFPKLNFSPYYTKLLKESDDKAVKGYLSEKLRQAKWTIHAVEQRKSTLTACAQCMVEIQENFFRFQEGQLKPMSLADISQRVGIHESTVWRTVNGKYLRCSKGTYPLSYFFSRKLGTKAEGKEITPSEVKKMLRELIDREDKSKPLSDQMLCSQLSSKGYALSRRAVAKYRNEMNIPSASGRKFNV